MRSVPCTMTVRLAPTSCAGRPSRTPVSPNTNKRSGAPPEPRRKLKRTPGGVSFDSPSQRVPSLDQSTRASTAPATRARRYPSPDSRHPVGPAAAAGAEVGGEGDEGEEADDGGIAGSGGDCGDGGADVDATAAGAVPTRVDAGVADAGRLGADEADAGAANAGGAEAGGAEAGGDKACVDKACVAKACVAKAGVGGGAATAALAAMPNAHAAARAARARERREQRRRILSADLSGIIRPWCHASSAEC